jgi:hypothetical protein
MIYLKITYNKRLREFLSQRTNNLNENNIVSSVVQTVGNGTNTFRMRTTKIKYNHTKIFDRITDLIRNNVLEIISEGIYVSSFSLYKKVNYISMEIYVFDEYIEVITSVITY